jgi:ferredoxin
MDQAGRSVTAGFQVPLPSVPLVTISGDGEPLVVELPAGSTLFEAGARVSAGIDTACVGKGTCGLCRVKILAGAPSLNPYTDEERKHLGNVYHITKVRLACRCKLADGDVTIQVVRKRK